MTHSPKNGKTTTALAELRGILAIRRGCLQHGEREAAADVLEQARSVCADRGLSCAKPWRTLARRGR